MVIDGMQVLRELQKIERQRALVNKALVSQAMKDKLFAELKAQEDDLARQYGVGEVASQAQKSK